MSASITFSSRTNWDLAENDLTLAIREARRARRELFDLTVSNPTVCGFDYDSETLLRPLSETRAMRYEPEPLGMWTAREAVGRYYGDAGTLIEPSCICLTTSTSEAYSFLFRLLCDPGDEVLIARPSYPLFDYIAQLDDVQLREYPLFYDEDRDHGWHIDCHTLKKAITPRTKAVVVVHPNNPTGNLASEAERSTLDQLCAEYGLALIVDEVFLDYAVGDAAALSFTQGSSEALTFVLSGLSKVCGLPQMKVSWIAACGPPSLAGPAMARLEVIADTFLSMNAPMQFALPQWLAERSSIQQQIRTRVRSNLAALDERVRGTQGTRLALQGGWTVVLRVPRHMAGESFVQTALAHGVVVQPGEFYGLPAGRIVLSLLTPPEVWQQGLAQLPID